MNNKQLVERIKRDVASILEEVNMLAGVSEGQKPLRANTTRRQIYDLLQKKRKPLHVEDIAVLLGSKNVPSILSNITHCSNRHQYFKKVAPSTFEILEK